MRAAQEIPPAAAVLSEQGIQVRGCSRCAYRRLSTTRVRFSTVQGGTPLWTRPSTNATCQPEKPESPQVKTWGSASTLGVDRAPPRNLSSNQRERATCRNVRNVGDTVEVTGRRCCQQKACSELGLQSTGSPENVFYNSFSQDSSMFLTALGGFELARSHRTM